MTQEQRRCYLINELLKEYPKDVKMDIPMDEQGQKQLLRSLFNVRQPQPVSPLFLQVQDAYLQEELSRKKIVHLRDLKPIQQNIYLWQGDITTLQCDAIVNAANSQMLGCFIPCHGCIDNAIHTFAGVQLRLTCAQLMKQRRYAAKTGSALITPAFNLPCEYILHTVGPIVRGLLTKQDEQLLASCYRSCLALAEQNGIQSVAFCCISTGEFHFPHEQAARIAIQTVQEYQAKISGKMEVIFNVFTQTDLSIYQKLLGTDPSAQI